MSTRDELIAERAEWVAALAIAKATYSTIIGKTNKTYNFEEPGGSGAQSATKFSPKELREEIEQIQAKIDDIDARLYHRAGPTRLGWRP